MILRDRRVVHKLSPLVTNPLLQQSRGGLALFEDGCGSQDFEGAAKRKALIRTMAQESSTPCVQGIQANSAIKLTFELTEIYSSSKAL